MRDHQKEKGAEQSEGLEAALKPDGALPEHMLNAMLANFDNAMESTCSTCLWQQLKLEMKDCVVITTVVRGSGCKADRI